MARQNRAKAIRSSLEDNLLGNVNVIETRSGVSGFQVSSADGPLPLYNHKAATSVDRYWIALGKQVRAGARVTVRHPDPRRFRMY